jgi:hypothetical protein
LSGAILVPLASEPKDIYEASGLGRDDHQPTRVADVAGGLLSAAKISKSEDGKDDLTSNTGPSVVDIDSEEDETPEPAGPSTQNTANVSHTPSVSEIQDIRVLSPTARGTDGQVDHSDVSDDATHSFSELSIHQQDDESEVTHKTDSRSPSPWQEIENAEAERHIAIATAWMIKRFGGEPCKLQFGTENSAGTSVTSSDTPNDSAEGAVSCASGGSTGSDNEPSTGSSASGLDTTSSMATPDRLGSKRARCSNGRAGGNEDDEPSGKRISLATSGEQLPRPRFACPYQKYDPFGSPFCFMASNKNPEGGAETFARIK